jgi:hypothetical protein
VIDRGDYLRVRSRSAVVFDLDSRLPRQVFKTYAEGSLFCEFDAVLDPEFWPALCAMAVWHGDEFVDLLALEPDVEAHYLPKYGLYQAMSLSVEAGVDDYWAAIGWEFDDEDPMRSIALSADVIAIAGDSGKWGCWGERNPEIAIFRGFPDENVRNEWRTQFGPFLEVSGAIEQYLSFVSKGRPVPAEYASLLTANYSPRSGERL